MPFFKYAFFSLIYTISLGLSSTGQSAVKDYSDCSIGICNFEEVNNPDLKQFEKLQNQLSSIYNKSVSDENDIEIKKTKECKKITKKQFLHMFYGGDPKDGMEYDDYSNVSHDIKYQKFQAISKEFIVYEVKVSTREVRANLFNMKAPDRYSTEEMTLIQKRGSCELVKYLRGTPFSIN